MAITSGRLLLGPHCGRLALKTAREGLASRMGHDLTIEVTRWRAEVDLPETGPADARLVAEIDLGSLSVIEGRNGVVPLTDRDRREIESNARRVLAPDRFPPARFESTQVVPAQGLIRGTLSLHGQVGDAWLRVVELGEERLRASTTITQTAYGITPYSAFFGALKLRDDVEAECEIDLARATHPE